MNALLHYNFHFMCGKGLNYIDLRSVLAIDRSQGVQLLGTRTTQQHTTSGQTFALTEIQSTYL